MGGCFTYTPGVLEALDGVAGDFSGLFDGVLDGGTVWPRLSEVVENASTLTDSVDGILDGLRRMDAEGIGQNAYSARALGDIHRDVRSGLDSSDPTIRGEASQIRDELRQHNLWDENFDPGDCSVDHGKEFVKAIEKDLPKDSVFKKSLPSPLVIDLDGDGVELISLADGAAFFDLNLDGFAEHTGWVSPDDALLALDIDGDGIIDDVSELFGDQTGHANGFLALAAHDSNSDGVIDANDALFSDLIVWQDLNGDGFSSANEMLSLTDVGITSIDLAYVDVNETNAGHAVFQSSTVTLADGTTRDVDDVYFQTDPRTSVYLLPDGFEYHEDAFKLPVLFGYGQIASTWVALSDDATLRQDAESLLLHVRNKNMDAFLTDFENFVLAWAGVDDVDPSSRGPYVDARYLAFLEKAYGTGYDQTQGTGPFTPNPGQVPGPLLNAQFHELLSKLAARFLAQSAVSDALINATTQAEFDQLLADHPLLGASELIANYSPASRSLDGALEDVLSGLSASVDSGNATIAFAAAFLDLAQVDYEPDRAVFQAALDSAATTIGTDAAAALARAVDLAADRAQLVAGDTDDTITVTEASFIAGAAGNDTITGSDQEDVYVYHLGDGADTITDVSSNSARIDRLLLADVTTGDVIFGQTANGDLVITFSDGGSITITRHFDSTYYDMERIEFADGTILDEAPIRAKALEDQKDSGLVRGTKFADDYLHNLGDGSYTIEDNNSGSTIDRLTLDVNADNVTFRANAGDDLEITFSNGEIITVKDHFGSTFWDLEQIVFADGTVFGLADIVDKAMTGTAGDDTIIGTSKKDMMIGGDGDDVLIGNSQMDTLAGGMGSDTLTGGSWADTFVFADGDTGIDVVTDFEVNKDKLDVTDWALTGFGDLTLTSTLVSSNNYTVVVSDGTNSFELTGLTTNELNALDAGDFVFN